MESKLAKELREIEVFNTHGLLMRFGGKKDVAITYSGYDRIFRLSAGARVYSPHMQTDPNAHWQQNGQKFFTPYTSGSKKGAIEAAKDWCREQYGITEWDRNPTQRDSLIPKHVLEAAKAAVKSHQKTKV